MPHDESRAARVRIELLKNIEWPFKMNPNKTSSDLSLIL